MKPEKSAFLLSRLENSSSLAMMTIREIDWKLVLQGKMQKYCQYIQKISDSFSFANSFHLLVGFSFHLQKIKTLSGYF